MGKKADRTRRPSPDGPSARRVARGRRPVRRRTSAPRPIADVDRMRVEVAVLKEQGELHAQAAEDATQALEISRQRYVDLYDLAPIPYVTLDGHGVVRDSNLAAARLLGGTREGVRGYPLLRFVDPGDRRKWHEHLRCCRGTAGEATTELGLACHDGRRGAVRIMSRRIVGVDGRYLVLSALLDITARKEAEVSLARRQAWDAAKVAIGRVAVAGAPLEAILAAALDAVAQAAGTPVGVLRLVEPETRDLVLVAQKNVPAAFREAAGRIAWGTHLAGHVAATGTECVVADTAAEPDRGRLKDYTDPPLGALVCVPLTAHGQVVGTLTLGHPEARHFDAREVAELQVCADMLAGAVRAERLREALRREADARALLLRELDHRVRNTLATLIGLLHLTAEHAAAPTEAVLRATADRVARLADVHATLAEQGQRRADLGQLAELVAKSVLDRPAPAAPIRWTVAVPPVDLSAAQAAPVALVLHELLTNCVKHAFPDGADGTVWVEGRRDGPDVHLTVGDDGRAVAPARLRAGAGLTLVETLVTHTLRGALWLATPRDGGFLVHVRFAGGDSVEPGAVS